MSQHHHSDHDVGRLPPAGGDVGPVPPPGEVVGRVPPHGTFGPPTSGAGAAPGDAADSAKGSDAAGGHAAYNEERLPTVGPVASPRVPAR